MKKSRRKNLKLREKRWENDVELFDFPIQIRVKPTTHKQYCFLCRELTDKRQRQIVMESGQWSKLKGVKKVQSVQGKWWISGGANSTSRMVFPRKIYLHTHCFVCLLKKMFAQANIPMNPNCDSCSIRFDCYTGNLSLDNRHLENSGDDGEHIYTERPAYTPSRPCKHKHENRES